METSASFEARSAPSPYPTTQARVGRGVGHEDGCGGLHRARVTTSVTGFPLAPAWSGHFTVHSGAVKSRISNNFGY